MSQLNKFESNKLHYGKYLYKLQIKNPLSPIFRTEFNKGKSHSRKKLDEYQELIQNGDPLTITRWRHEEVISDNFYFDAETIYNFIQIFSDDLKIRCEGSWSLILYSNDKDSLISLSKKIKMNECDFYEPNPDYAPLLTNNKVVLIDSPSEWIYKVYFKCSVKNKVDPGFANWIAGNSEKIKIGDTTLDNVKRGGYLNDHYFYVKTDKILSLIRLMIGHNIRRIEKRVYKGDIDKYNYAK
jgi:hypothetical protein